VLISGGCLHAPERDRENHSLPSIIMRELVRRDARDCQ
jgi:hypothetical protein